MEKIYYKSYPRMGGQAVKTEEGRLWKSMNTRCKPDYEQKSYHGCSMSDNFKNFQYFAGWCHSQIGFGCVDEFGSKWHLDKDILVKGNKVYSENTCVFVPPLVNALLVRSTATRGALPVGVCTKREVFRATCSNPFTKKRDHLGSYKTVIEAFLAYKDYKECLIKQVVDQYRGLMDDRVVDALYNYIVEITD